MELEKCAKHPRYKVKRKPTSTCERCWILWVMNLDARVLGSVGW